MSVLKVHSIIINNNVEHIMIQQASSPSNTHKIPPFKCSVCVLCTVYSD